MKKLIATLFICGLILSISACGNKADTEATNVTETAVEEAVVETPTAEPTEAPTPEPTAESTPEPTPEPTEEPVEEFTADMGMEKIVNLFNARNELFNSVNYKKDLNFLLYTESILEPKVVEDFNISTKDGLSLDTYGNYDTSGGGISRITTFNYFYDYINSNSGYYSLEEYVTTHTENEIRSYLNIKLSNQDTNCVIMYNALVILEYLVDNSANITCGNLISGDACTSADVSGIKVAYELPILINNEFSGAKAVFDVDGNMLNIVTNDEEWDYNNYYDCWDKLVSSGLAIPHE